LRRRRLLRLAMPVQDQAGKVASFDIFILQARISPLCRRSGDPIGLGESGQKGLERSERE
jgi:hypothetical protein